MTREKRLILVKAFLEQGCADPNSYEDIRGIPLYNAKKLKYAELIDVLVANGAVDDYAPGRKPVTASRARSYPAEDITKLLVLIAIHYDIPVADVKINTSDIFLEHELTKTYSGTVEIIRYGQKDKVFFRHSILAEYGSSR
ncbi:MAG: hypothetical protein JW724_02655 [Candidatus Altiarchaeota archaeon]|nr:hypothetical protein [Candidatus Altiarchaeota archaeon]